MLSDYLIVHKSILPEYFEKVLECRRLMESGKVREVSQAVRQVGISRSTYYKYKDYIFEPTDLTGSRKAVFSMHLGFRRKCPDHHTEPPHPQQGQRHHLH